MGPTRPGAVPARYHALGEVSISGRKVMFRLGFERYLKFGKSISPIECFSLYLSHHASRQLDEASSAADLMATPLPPTHNGRRRPAMDEGVRPCINCCASAAGGLASEIIVYEFAIQRMKPGRAEVPVGSFARGRRKAP